MFNHHLPSSAGATPHHITTQLRYPTSSRPYHTQTSKIKFAAVILSLDGVAQGAAVAVPGAKTVLRRETHANVTLKLEACVDTCPSSDWGCSLN